MNSARGFGNFVDQIDRALDAFGITTTAIAGVSYGGLIALRYAAERPERIKALILVSTPGPRWALTRRAELYLRRPRLTAPLFFAGSPFRLWPEIYAAYASWHERAWFSARHLARVAAAPCSPSLMAERVKLTTVADRLRDCGRIGAPTLVITGEAGLDRVVPVGSTLEYQSAIPGALAATLERTGHIGYVTRPAAFAGAVGEFVTARAWDSPT